MGTQPGIEAGVDTGRDAGRLAGKDRSAALSFLLAAILCCLLFWFFFCLRKPFWFDELSTLFVASQQSVAGVWATMAVDAQPPLDALLVRGAQHLPFALEVSTRLPALAAILLGGLAIFHFLRRVCAFEIAAAGACSFLLGRAFFFALDMRPYTLVIGLSAAALWLWQRASFQKESRGTSLVLLALTIAMLTLSNSYGILFAAVPIFLGEAVRFFQTRRLDRGIAISSVLGSLPLLIAVKNLPRVHDALLVRMPRSSTLPATASFPHLVSTLFAAFRAPAFLVFALVVAVHLVWRKADKLPTTGERGRFSRAEWAAVTGFFLAGLLCWAVTAVSTHYFYSRYGGATIAGASLLLGMLLNTGKAPKRTVMVLCGWAMCLVFAVDSARTLHREFPGSSAYANSPATLLQALPPTGDAVVPASALVAWPMFHYANAEQRKHIVFVGSQAQTERTSDSAPEATLLAYSDMGKPVMPMSDPEDWARAHGEFLVVSNPGLAGEWLPAWLVAHGYTRTAVSDELYRYTRQ